MMAVAISGAACRLHAGPHVEAVPHSVTAPAVLGAAGAAAVGVALGAHGSLADSSPSGGYRADEGPPCKFSH